ncbi:MAG: SUMF1/EgtB/PvdO family nonheme iron enzyme [Lentimicrobiaceae bacterium]|nr:SUMF1/EgtB/PvdO family nonheme iron enzyme [Lentimicrobiaceae bacterium]
MKKSVFLMMVVVALLALNACNNSNGQLVGAQDRPTFLDEVPYGMVFIPQGHFLMGVGEQDPAYTQAYAAKNVTVTAFYMDETEITNNEYRQFVEWVRDSIAHILLAEQYEDDKVSHYVLAPKGSENEGEPIEPKLINWKAKIDWKSTNEEYRAVLSQIYSSPMGNDRYYYYKMTSLNVKILNYEYWWFDRRNFRDEEDPTVIGAAFKDFDNIDPQTDDMGMFANRPLAYSQGARPFVRHDHVNIYPDTLCWMHDFTYSNNEPMTESYFWHPQYDNYPVVGVNWKQAQAFCHWRTHMRNSYLGGKEWAYEGHFRLPSEAEWEYASRGDLHANPYSFGGPYAMNDKGCFLANFKPRRGDYGADGGVYPIIVAHYHPNDFGLYDMSGNVAEWCEDAYDPSAFIYGHDLNMQYTYYAKKGDHPNFKRKVIRGGSWKDISDFIRPQTRDFEYQDSCKPYIGFRCVQTYYGRDRKDNMKTASNVY